MTNGTGGKHTHSHTPKASAKVAAAKKTLAAAGTTQSKSQTGATKLRA